MSRLLYISCELRPSDKSCCLVAGMTFLDQYLKKNPHDEIHMLDLYRDLVQPADRDVIGALEKTARGHHFATLTSVEQRKLSRISTLAEQFASAQKYVLVTPMWKPGFPAEVWEYLDAVLVAGKTYRNTSTGPQGLLKDGTRKCLLIHTPEGFDYGRKELHCVSNVRNTMKFLGIDEFSSILIDGANPTDNGKVVVVGKEMEKVAQAASIF